MFLLGEHDDASYVPDSDKSADYGRDCIEVGKTMILEKGWANETDIAAWQNEAIERTEEAMAIAQKEPGPDPRKETWQVLQSGWLIDEAESSNVSQ